jgi:hypothetical protein
MNPFTRHKEAIRRAFRGPPRSISSSEPVAKSPCRMSRLVLFQTNGGVHELRFVRLEESEELEKGGPHSGPPGEKFGV